MRVDRAAVAPVEHGAFHDRHADAADHAADTLAGRQPRVHHLADAIGAHHAPDVDGRHIRVDRHLGEHGAKGMHRVAAGDFRIARSASLTDDGLPAGDSGDLLVG
ncbi:hypothetical protein D3C87_1671990 [compost metagenome]